MHKDYIVNMIAGLTIAILSILIPALAIKWEMYKYDDCRKVGHTKVYCLFAKN